MKKQPLFDVSRFNHLADKYNVPWIDRIPLIETVCWGSKGWLDSALVAKLRGRWTDTGAMPNTAHSWAKLCPRCPGLTRRASSQCNWR